MQPKFHNGSVRSIVFPEFRTVYSGDPRTGQRIEDYIMQLTGEATRGASVCDDPNAAEKFRGRCAVFGGMVYQFYLSRSVNWSDIGFTRRFLFSFFNLEDPELLNRAGVKWTKIHFGEFNIPEVPISGSIPMLITEPERARILEWLRHQPDNPNHSIRQHLMCRAASVLRWHAGVKKLEDDSMEVMKNFSETLQREAPLLTVANPFPNELGNGFSALKLMRKGKTNAK
jgi:hypothetical protein